MTAATERMTVHYFGWPDGPIHNLVRETLEKHGAQGIEEGSLKPKGRGEWLKAAIPSANVAAARADFTRIGPIARVVDSDDREKDAD
jgi:hypothetical protein